MKNLLRASLSIVLVTFVLYNQPGYAQQQFRDAANKTTLGIISGNVKGTYARFAYDMSSILDEDDILRIVPMLGRGSIQNMSDLLWLKGVDMAIVQSDVLAHYARDGAAGVQNIRGVVRYITKLYNEEIHVLATEGIDSLQQLNGKKIAIGSRGSGTTMTSLMLLNSWNIEAETINLSSIETVAQLKSGDIDAAFMVSGKPTSTLKDVATEDNIHLIPVNLSPELEQLGYLSSVLESTDYPGIVAAESPVNTIAVGAVLAVYNWKSDHDKYRRLSLFSKRLLEQLDDVKQNTAKDGGPYHPKWVQVDVKETIPSWTRFAPTSLLLGE